MPGSISATSRRNSDDFRDAINEEPCDTETFSTMTQELRKLNLSDPAQMMMIDKLRELGIKDVALPQLVVVGDQSSGKSSVLEAITDFPFPRNSGLCTRFATNIILRRSAITSLSIRIIGGEGRGSSRTQEFDIFYKSFRNQGIENLDEARFQSILDEASRAMGIIGKDETRTADNRAFSDDVLQVELSGPDQDNLSIIDVPGIFRSELKGHTTKEDIPLVENIVRSYIKDETTIILAVLAANVDLANQEILAMAKEADPKGLRTLGVLTKPDIVDKGGEKEIIDLFHGKGNELALGYCIVRNHGQNELTFSSAHRFENERKFFLTSPWNTIDEDRVGIKSLKTRLQDLLAEMIKREFPKLKLKIDDRLRTAKANLEELGSDRESPDEQRKFLEGIAMKFQNIRADTMDKMYFRHDVLMKNPDLRLPTIVAKEFDQLVVSFRQQGHMVNFNDADESDSESQDGSETESLSDGESVIDSDSQNDTDTVSLTGNRCLDERYQELDDITIDAPYEYGPGETDAKTWIEKEYRATRGYNIEVLNANILPLLWRRQSQNWLELTKEVTDEVIFLVHRYIHHLLESLCDDRRTMEELRNFLMDDILEKYKIALSQIELLIKIERHGSPITKNHYFADTLSKIRSQRTRADLEADTEELNLKDSNGKPFTRKMISVNKLKNSQTYKSKIAQEVDDLHSVLMVYHKVARKRIVDSIIQNIDYFLLSGENSPLNILTPMYISSLTNEQLEQIAGDDMVSKNKRRDLKITITKLEEGRRVINGPVMG